jgi:hypothetical protein
MKRHIWTSKKKPVIVLESHEWNAILRQESDSSPHAPDASQCILQLLDAPTHYCKYIPDLRLVCGYLMNSLGLMKVVWEDEIIGSAGEFGMNRNSKMLNSENPFLREQLERW